LSISLHFFLLPILFLFSIKFKSMYTSISSSKLPRSYLLIGLYFSLYANRDPRIMSYDLVTSSPSLTFILNRYLTWHLHRKPVQCPTILKTQFHKYGKGNIFRRTLSDLLGDGIFNADGESMKFLRLLSDRLRPILATTAANRTILDYRGILQGFAFDNICKISFGYDPSYLLPSFPRQKFTVTFEDVDRISNGRFNTFLPLIWKAKKDFEHRFVIAFEGVVRISSGRFNTFLPLIWKAKRVLNIVFENQLCTAVKQVREFAREVIKEKKKELNDKSLLEYVDLLSRSLNFGHCDEDYYVIDIIIRFILVGRDTTSTALTWFFWLMSTNPNVDVKFKSVR
ncbi:LOW QUALITY PROTEIN: hypothetical protein RJ639_023894, partial [Escallonia herrerae]